VDRRLWISTDTKPATAAVRLGSISLGLIVTELVINALEHAFPKQETGRIVIDYRSAGTDWTLTVTDNGVGMPVGRDAPLVQQTKLKESSRNNISLAWLDHRWLVGQPPWRVPCKTKLRHARRL